MAKERPEFIQVFGLPPGYMVIFKDQDTKSIADENNKGFGIIDSTTQLPR